MATRKRDMRSSSNCEEQHETVNNANGLAPVASKRDMRDTRSRAEGSSEIRTIFALPKRFRQ